MLLTSTPDRSRGSSPTGKRSNHGSYTPSYRPHTMAIDNDLHPVMMAGRVAVITGAASGIGRAAAHEFAKLGLKVAIADIQAEKLHQVGEELGLVLGETLLVVPTDVSKLEEVVRLRDRVYDAWGEVAVLMNNAGVADRGTSWAGIENWRKVFEVNLFGMVNVQQTFVPSMLHQENQAVIINTGSKQGITNPPGNAAYNASKAAVKSLTEGLAHELRENSQSNVTAHLFIPGWTYTAMTGATTPTRTPTSSPSSSPKQSIKSGKPAGAWTAEETVQYLLDRVRSGDFYILVPDNDTRREVDELRIMWAAEDVVEGRPALSRWHPNYKALFEEYVREGLSARE